MQFDTKFSIRLAQILFCASLISFLFACKEKTTLKKEENVKISVDFKILSLVKANRNLSAIIAEKDTIIAKYDENLCDSCKKITEIYKPTTYLEIFYPIKHDEVSLKYKKVKDSINFKFKLNSKFRYLFVVAIKNSKSNDEIAGLCMWNLDFSKFKIIPKRLEITCKEQEKVPYLSPITINY